MNKSFFILLLGFTKAWATEDRFGYKVTSASKTVIQIARDAYSDERQWKRIAYYNSLTPPFSLKVGQQLVLPKPPVNELGENLITGADVPQPKFLAPNLSRDTSEEKNLLVYTVSDRAPFLFLVALDLYGNTKMASVIAKWNGLSPKVKLGYGQKLILRHKPTMPEKEANNALAQFWKKTGNVQMAAWISGRQFSPNTQIAGQPAAPVRPMLLAASAKPKQLAESPKPTQPPTLQTPPPVVAKPPATASVAAAPEPIQEIKRPSPPVSPKPQVTSDPEIAAAVTALPSRVPAAARTEPNTDEYWLGSNYQALLIELEGMDEIVNP